MWKTFWTLKSIHDLSKHELTDSAQSDKRVTCEAIANFMAP